MPNYAYTYTPSVNDDGSYNLDNGTLIARSGGGRVDAVFEEDEMTGERQYLIEQEDLESDLDYAPATEDEYIQAITELYPDLQDALDYAFHNWTPELIEDFNNKVDGGDFDGFVPLIEELMEEYRSTVSAPVENQIPDDADVTQEEIDEALEPMLESEPEGMETAYNWLQAAEDYQVSNPVFSAVCAATAAFHNNEMTASEAISSVIDNYPMKDVIRIYKHLSQQQ